MIKPKMAEGSRLDGIMVHNGKTTVGVSGGGYLDIDWRGEGACAREADVIRALYEGGPLRPLWDAAVNLIEVADRGAALGEFADAFDRLRRVIDEMKEPEL